MPFWIDVEHNIFWPPEILKRMTEEMVETAGNQIVEGIREGMRESLRVPSGRNVRLSEETIRRKYRDPNAIPAYYQTPLIRSGILYRAIHFYKTGPNAGFVGIIDRGRIGRREVAGYQQNGTGTIPARPFFGINRVTRERLRLMFNRWNERFRQRIKSFKGRRIEKYVIR